MERLSINLNEAVRDKLIHPINFRTGVRLSHLFFADDIFLFTRATARDCKNLNRIMMDFCAMSGQLMSVTKSKTWFSPRTPRRIKDQVAGILGLPTTDRKELILEHPFLPPVEQPAHINTSWIISVRELKDGKLDTFRWLEEPPLSKLR